MTRAKLRRFLVLLPLAGAIVLLAALPSPESAPERPSSYGAVGPFSLTAPDGRTVTLADFKGKVWVAYNFFTSCTTSCPLTTLKAAQLVKEFGGRADFRVVGLTVDPAHDTPPTLAAFATSAKADPARWTFLTGDPAALRQVDEAYFRVGFDGPREAAHGGHSGLFVLVGRDARIKGVYPGSDATAFGRLKHDIQALYAE